MATLTLRRMAEGGINDQLGGGFCRYAVDEYWMIPHFEKMLYDNGALLAVYAQAALARGDALYARVARETAGWVLSEMQSPQGGYYSSLDADSEGHEGKFYVWDREEVARGAQQRGVSRVRAALRARSAAELRGPLAPARGGPERGPRRAAGHHAAGGRARSSTARVRKLLAIRAQRVRPARDEKILTSWNALMIRGMAIAARALASRELAASATRALDFVRGTLWRDGRLLATYMDGRAHLNAYLDDYVYLADAVLELQQVRFAQRRARVRAAAHGRGARAFRRPRGRLLFHLRRSRDADSSPEDRSATMRRRPATASPRCVLLRLGHLLGEPRYLAAAEGTLRAAWAALERYPQAHVSLLLALEELLDPPEIVILRGEARTIEGWRLRARAPLRAAAAHAGDPLADCNGLPAALADKTSRAAPVAYVCRGSSCSAPLDSQDALLAILEPAAAA